MLLDSNTERVMNLVDKVDDLKGIDKIRLITHLLEEQYALEYIVYQTTKFGVELPAPEIDKHITATPSYNAWYKFYSNHFKDILTDEQWNAFQQAQRNGQDASAFMPSRHWTDLLEKPVQKSLKPSK